MDPSRLPPPLTWVHSFCVSTGGALGQPIVFDVKTTVNPLVYKLLLNWEEAVPGPITLQIWNLLQRWIAMNDCVPNGTADTHSNSLTIHVIVKRRFGNPKDESP